MQDGILFCTPCYGGMVLEPHFRSCLALCQDMVRMDIPFSWLTGRNESLVNRARMEMTASFLETDYSHMMWLDADLDFTTDDVGKLWNLAVEGGADIAAAAYPMKRKGVAYGAWKDGVLVEDIDQFDGPTEIDVAGTGFMLIGRHVIEALVEKHGTYQGQNGRVPAVYMVPVHEDTLESEDYHFCRLAKEAGFKLMIEPSVRLGHWGLWRYDGAS